MKKYFFSYIIYTIIFLSFSCSSGKKIESGDSMVTIENRAAEKHIDVLDRW
jgi:hypothetical protein